MVSKGSSVTLISTKMFSNNEKPFVIPKIFISFLHYERVPIFFLVCYWNCAYSVFTARFPSYVVPSSSSLSLPSTDIVSSGYPLLINS